MDYTIEQLTVRDFDLVVDAVVLLLEELGEERQDLGAVDREKLKRDWERDRERVFVFGAFDVRHEMIGLVTVSEMFALFANGAIGVINEMFVLPERRSAGVGTALLESVKVLGRKRGWSRMDVTAPESERWMRTRRFYEREGFHFAGPKLKLQLGA